MKRTIECRVETLETNLANLITFTKMLTEELKDLKNKLNRREQLTQYFDKLVSPTENRN